MLLSQLWLQHFRSYNNFHLAFSDTTTVIVGENTAGKTNLIEAIWLLSTGKSFRVEKDIQMVQFDHEIARVKGKITNDELQMTNEKNDDETTVEVVLASGNATGGRFLKKYLVNDTPKRRADFAGRLPAVLFSPEELDIVNAGPSLRRKFLDDVLEQIDIAYRRAALLYEKALRQRNALLNLAKETGKRNAEQFTYWDGLLISNGQYLTQKRQEFIDFINASEKSIFGVQITYDASTISSERLVQYKDAEIGAGVTLVGPHRDDFLIFHKDKEVKYFGSRGQQRLAILQLKILQLAYIEEITRQKPLLLLDDIFSELDEKHMQLVVSMIGQQQTIMTTTHREFVDESRLEDAKVVELE